MTDSKFKKGQVANPAGRPKGATNKVTAELKEMILQALDKKGGVDYLVEQAGENPQAFMTLLGKVLPRDLNVQLSTEDKLKQMKEHELIELLESLRRTREEDTGRTGAGQVTH